MKLGIRDLKAKSRRGSGLKIYARGGMPKITLGITGLHEILGRDYGIEEPYWGPSLQQCSMDIRVSLSKVGKEPWKGLLSKFILGSEVDGN